MLLFRLDMGPLKEVQSIANNVDSVVKNIVSFECK